MTSLSENTSKTNGKTGDSTGPTPGPWVWRRRHVAGGFAEPGQRYLVGSGEIPIAALNESAGPKKEANARLIAAAPDLYAALNAYHAANRIHNDLEAELFELSKAALALALAERSRS